MTTVEIGRIDALLKIIDEQPDCEGVWLPVFVRKGNHENIIEFRLSLCNNINVFLCPPGTLVFPEMN